MTLFILGLAWAAGIFLAANLQSTAWEWGVFAIPPMLAGLLVRDQAKLRLLAWSLALMLLGALRYELAQPQFPPSHIKHENDSGRFIQVTGVIQGFPDAKDRSLNLVLAAESIQTDVSPPRTSIGKVLIQAPRLEQVAYGDRVTALGYLQTAPEYEDFSYRQYLAARGIHSIMPLADVLVLESSQASPLLSAIFDLRTRARETIYTLYPDPEASLMAGILLGIESGISPDLREAFNRTGTAHIIAISGFNITIISAVAILFFGRIFGQRRGVWLAGITIAFYTVLAGGDASVVRAAIMGGLALFARAIGRQTHALAALAGAAILMTLISPNILWDVGFQLSFAATLGLILYADPMKSWFTGAASRLVGPETAERISGPISEFVLLTFAAQIPTLPLSALHFRVLSPISILANPLILPLQPALMLLGGAATLLGLIWIPLARPIAWLAWPLPAYSIRIAELLAEVPSGSIDIGRIGAPLLLLIYLALFGFTLLIQLPSDSQIKVIIRSVTSEMRRLPLLSGLAIVTALAWAQIGDLPDGETHVTMITSETILIESPSGRYVLIGGGSSPVALSEALGRRLPLFRREIDWVIPTSDSLTALESTMKRFKIRNALLPPSVTHFGAALAQSGVPFLNAQAGQMLDLGGGASLSILAANSQGTALLLTHQQAQFLLLSGSEPPSSLSHVSAILFQDAILSFPVGQLRPQVIVLSINERDRFAGESLQGYPLFRTDQHGWIRLSTDGQVLRATVERLP